MNLWHEYEYYTSSRQKKILKIFFKIELNPLKNH